MLQAPALFGDDAEDYARGFQIEMLVVDLAIVLLLALVLPGSRGQVISAVAVYTLGVVTLSGVVLDDSLIDAGPLALARFDLVPAALTLAAVLARDARLSATWSALLSVAAGVKAYPLLLYPALLRGERRLARVALAAAVPVLVCGLIVLAWGISSAMRSPTTPAAVSRSRAWQRPPSRSQACSAPTSPAWWPAALTSPPRAPRPPSGPRW